MSEGVIGDRLQIMNNYIKDPQVWLRGRTSALAGAVLRVGARLVFGDEHDRAAAGRDWMRCLCFVTVKCYQGLI